jgi:hypothetical protein
VILLIPATNPHASALTERFRLEKIFETIRMYKGQPRKVDQEKSVGLTLLEIG